MKFLAPGIIRQLAEAVQRRCNLLGRVDHRAVASEYGVPVDAMESDKIPLTCDYSHLEDCAYRFQTQDVVP